MNLTRIKNNRFLFRLIIIIGCILVGFIVILVGVNFNSQNPKKTNLLQLKREEWLGFVKIKTELEKIENNWGKADIRRKSKDDLELQDFIKQEFERQIVEIKRVSNVEAALKRAELEQNFLKYSKRRSNEAEQEYQQKLIALNNQLNLELQQKKLEFDQQYKKFKHDLEMAHQSNLVNLHLQLSIMELNPNIGGNAEEKKQIQQKIDLIIQEITQKSETQKQIFQTQYLEYDKLRRNQIAEELKTLKNDLKTSFENDLKTYRATLESEFNVWCEKQNIQFEKAIEVRQGAKRKSN